MLVDAEQRLHARAAPVAVKSKIGAGDSFVAAFTLALAEGRRPGAALQRGMGRSLCHGETEATRLCSRSMVRRLIPRCPVSAI